LEEHTREVIDYVFCALCLVCPGSVVSWNRQDCNHSHVHEKKKEPKHLNFFTCCRVLSLTRSIHCFGFLERHKTLVISVPIFIPAWFAPRRKPIKGLLKFLLRRCWQ